MFRGVITIGTVHLTYLNLRKASEAIKTSKKGPLENIFEVSAWFSTVHCSGASHVVKYKHQKTWIRS